MQVPFEQVSSPARIAFIVSVGAFSAGELVQAFHVGRGAARADVRAEALLRLMLFGGIVMFPLGRALAPGALIGGGGFLFAVGVVIAWAGAVLRWWSFGTLGSYSPSSFRPAPISPSLTEAHIGSCGIRATPASSSFSPAWA